MTVRSGQDIYESKCRELYSDDMPTDYERCRELEQFFENYSWAKSAGINYTYPSGSAVFTENGLFNRNDAAYGLKKIADDRKIHLNYLEEFIKMYDSPKKISEVRAIRVSERHVCRYEQPEPIQNNLPLPIYVNLLHLILRKKDIEQITEYNTTDDEDEDCNYTRIEEVKEEISYQKAGISAANQLAELGAPAYDIENYTVFFKNLY